MGSMGGDKGHNEKNKYLMWLLSAYHREHMKFACPTPAAMPPLAHNSVAPLSIL